MATALHTVRSRQEWAEVISTDWRKSFESIIQTGKDLESAKADLAHGEFLKMIEADLPFSRATAFSLMKVATHPVISNVASSKHLPPAWAVLSELTKLNERDFRDAQDSGLITPTTNARAARAIAGAYRAPEGTEVGKGLARPMLPKPRDASKIARETGRLVAADDGRMYTGATEEEGEDFTRRQTQTFRIRDAIELIANSDVTAKKWVHEADGFLLHDFKLASIDAAMAWLKDLRAPLAAKLKVVDAE